MNPQKNPLERFLNLFAPVEKGEGGTALLLALNIFLLLTAYYIIKPVREALILSGGGAEVKSYAAVGQALLMLITVPVYSKLADFMPRRRLINVVTLFFIGCLVVFYLLARTPVPLGVVFYLWVGIFNMMVIAQFWAFANDVYSPEQGKRLFAIVAFGASSGAVFGSWITGQLIAPLGVIQMLPISAAILFLSLVLANLVDRRERRRLAAVAEAGVQLPAEDEAIGGEGAFQLVWKHRYLLMIAFMMLLLNWVNTNGEYILGRVIQRSAEDAVAAGQAADAGDFIGKFYANFFFWVNLAGMLIQLFLVSRILKYLGVRVALIILPAIALGGYVLLALYPVLSVVRWAKTAENSTDYSLNNTVRNVLFLPTSREEKYKAKQAIDSFFVRAGDVLSAALVYAGVHWLSFGTGQFAMVNILLVSAWIVLVIFIGREYRRRCAEGC